MIQISEVNFTNPEHVSSFKEILNSYATDIMGGGVPLEPEFLHDLVIKLPKIENKLFLLAFDQNKAISIANCFYTFSTFKAKPILNIHDFAIIPEARGKGFAKIMLEEIEKRAAAAGCCKITLEVLEGNKHAQRIYNKFGFEGYELDPEMGKALFLEKAID